MRNPVFLIIPLPCRPLTHKQVDMSLSAVPHDMLPTSSLMPPQLWKVWELGLINALRKNSAFLPSVSVIKCVTLRP